MPALPSRHQHRLARVFHDRRRRRIGLFGGSFNPAHEGHAHIADLAVKRLRLDEIWWLVTPQNPLKDSRDMAPFKSRYESAKAMAGRCRYHQAMKVSALEARLGLSQTALSLMAISRRAPRAGFFWIMGADNLAGFHRWHRPRRIAATMPMIVINRPRQQAAALGSIGARIAGLRLTPERLARKRPQPRQWCFIHGPVNPLSASAIRAQNNFH
ncbi:MAG: nicotinate-nucleotide adenylyltransferase [Candidatus Puniceispirillales bacterium]